MVLAVALSVRAADSVACFLWCPMTCPDSDLYRPVLYCLVLYGRLWNVMSGRETRGDE